MLTRSTAGSSWDTGDPQAGLFRLRPFRKDVEIELNAFPHETAKVSDDQVDLEHPFSIRFTGVLQGNIEDFFGHGKFMHAGLNIAERKERSA